MGLKQQILDVSAAYCDAVGLSESRVSTRAFKSGHRLGKLRRGGDANSGTLEAGLFWFSVNWPEGALWPSHVPRPASAPSARDALPAAA